MYDFLEEMPVLILFIFLTCGVVIATLIVAIYMYVQSELDDDDDLDA